MILTSLFLGLLPAVYAEVHKLQLQKIPATVGNPELESLHLAEKYGVVNEFQTPLMGAGGAGRRLKNDAGEDLFWTQEQVKGGHGVPLTSAHHHVLARAALLTPALDFMNAQYFTEITLGTPPQNVSSTQWRGDGRYRLRTSAVQGHP